MKESRGFFADERRRRPFTRAVLSVLLLGYCADSEAQTEVPERPADVSTVSAVEIPKSKARRAKSQCARSRNSIYDLGSYEGRRSGKNTRRLTTFSRASLPMSKWICGR